MARIRTVKPEFFHDKRLAGCSAHARLLAIALLQLADCEGRIKNIPMQIHAHAFPWEAEVNTPLLLGELAEVGFVILWECDGDDYIFIPKFLEHQRLQGKEAQLSSKLPAYVPEKHGKSVKYQQVKDFSGDGEYTSASRGMTGTGEQGNRGRGIGTGEKEKEKEKEQGNSKTIVALKPDQPDHALEIFQFWQKTLNHPKAAFDPRRRNLVKRALKHYPVDDLQKAIVGCSLTPHNMGDNDRGEVYDSIELIFRDSAHIDRFMRNADSPPLGRTKTIQQTQHGSQQQADRIRQAMGMVLDE